MYWVSGVWFQVSEMQNLKPEAIEYKRNMIMMLTTFLKGG
jgi:hypothetical protein